MKKIFTIILLTGFLTSSIVMPFYNFQDTDSVKILYSQFIQQDDDGNVFEFITNDILNLGGFLEDEDEDKPQQPLPDHEKQLPFQTIQITFGSVIFTQPFIIEKEEAAVSPRVFCSFSDNNYKQNFSSFVFHPPACLS